MDMKKGDRVWTRVDLVEPQRPYRVVKIRARGVIKSQSMPHTWFVRFREFTMRVHEDYLTTDYTEFARDALLS